MVGNELGDHFNERRALLREVCVRPRHLALKDTVELPAARDDHGRDLFGHAESDPAVVEGNERRLGGEGST